jgi:FixJ family two-component response regulator
MITKKAFSRVNILRKFKFILDRKTLETIYITFIRPLLEYADVVWDTKTQILISYENCRRPGVAILDMQMSKVPIISGYELLRY